MNVADAETVSSESLLLVMRRRATWENARSIT